MNISYDPNVDALYISFRQVAVDNSDEVHEKINFDYDADGHVVGIEVLDASRLIAEPAEAHLKVFPQK